MYISSLLVLLRSSLEPLFTLTNAILSGQFRECRLTDARARRRHHKPLRARRSSESMWKGSGRTLFQTIIMENFKFTLFVVTPIVTASLFWNDAIVTYIVKSRKYVSYPPEGERPPTNQRELEERIAEQRRARPKEG